MKKACVWLFLILLIGGCMPHASELTVERLSEDKIDAADKNIVFLTSTKWDSQLRRALAKYDFTLKRYASVKEIEERISGVRTETYDEAEARYGISIYLGDVIDWCVFSEGIMFSNFTLEITDLRTNEVIMVVEKGGWTHDCSTRGPGKLFPDLARALSDEWH